MVLRFDGTWRYDRPTGNGEAVRHRGGGQSKQKAK